MNARVNELYKRETGTLNPHENVAEIVLNYFNELGHQIISARNEGRYLTAEECDHNEVKAMLKIGLFVDKLSGSFNSGMESEISKELFNETTMRYYDYILRIFNELLKSYEERPILN